MTKAVIQRRKRIIPTSQSEEEIEIERCTPPPPNKPPYDSSASASHSSSAFTSTSSALGPTAPRQRALAPLPHPITSLARRAATSHNDTEKLGLCRRPEDGPLTLLPDPKLQHKQRSSPAYPRRPTDLSNYHSFSPRDTNPLPDLSSENKLAPIKSLKCPSSAPMPGHSTVGDRQSSRSPASFVSPARKRSFSSMTEVDSVETHENSKRLSSIESILNPCDTSPLPRAVSPISIVDSDHPSAHPAQGSGCSPDLPPSQRPSPRPSCDPMGRSPISTTATVASAPSPGTFSNASAGTEERAGRKAALLREAERMRELLRETEAELAALD